MGFEPTRAEHIGLAVQRLNHSATSSTLKDCHVWKVCVIPLLFDKVHDQRQERGLEKVFPCRELNPDLLGESQLS